MEGAHPNILKRLADTNWQKMPGYGFDEISLSAKERIRKACETPNAEVEFLIGGTQTNAVMIDALLASYQGVIAADTGHISVHEAGAIEFGGHKGRFLPKKARLLLIRLWPMQLTIITMPTTITWLCQGWFTCRSQPNSGRCIPKLNCKPFMMSVVNMT